MERGEVLDPGSGERDGRGRLYVCSARTRRGRFAEIARLEGRRVLACAGSHGATWGAVVRQDGLVVAACLRLKRGAAGELSGLVYQGEGLKTVSGFDDEVHRAVFGLLTPPEGWPARVAGRGEALEWYARVALRGAPDAARACQFLPDGLMVAGTCAQVLVPPISPGDGEPLPPVSGADGEAAAAGDPVPACGREDGDGGDGIAAPVADTLLTPCPLGLRLPFLEGGKLPRGRYRDALTLPFWDPEVWYAVSGAVVVLDYTGLAWRPWTERRPGTAPRRRGRPRKTAVAEKDDTGAPASGGAGRRGRLSLRRFREMLLDGGVAGGEERVERMVAALERYRESRRGAPAADGGPDGEQGQEMGEDARDSVPDAPRAMPAVLANCAGTFNGTPFRAQPGPFMAGATQVPSPLLRHEPVEITCDCLEAMDTLGSRGALTCALPVRVLELVRSAGGEIIARVRYPFASSGRHPWAEAYRGALLGDGPARGLRRHRRPVTQGTRHRKYFK